MSTLERTARAMYERIIRMPIPGLNPMNSYDPEDDMHRWESQSEILRDTWRTVVHAALDELRNPNEAVLAATIPALTVPDTYDLDAFPEDIPAAALLVWQAMVDAIREGK